MAIALHRRHFAIIVTQAKCDAIIRCDIDLDNGFDFFFAIIKIFLMRYRSSFAILIFSIIF